MKRFISFVAVLVLVLSLGTTAFADETREWDVVFTRGADFSEEYDDYATSSALADVLSGLQPGDSATFYLHLKNEYPASTDWYMSNEVIDSLEASRNAASGGAYTYQLEYVSASGQTTPLYDSTSVGGENKPQVVNGEDREGLREATSGLEDDFFLDTLASGQTGRIRLHVALDGETQGNAYQDTQALLKMRFAVELNDITASNWRPVRTGDESNMLLWSGVMLGCGLAALLLGVYTLRRNRKNREENGDE